MKTRMYSEYIYNCNWGQEKIAAISHTTFSNAFSWMKMYEYHFRFHWSLFLRFELTIFQHWLRWCHDAWSVPSHYLDQWWLVYWCIYVSHSLSELSIWCSNQKSAGPVLTHWPLWDFAIMINWEFSNSYQEFVSWAFCLKLQSCECHITSLMNSQHWLR